MTRTLHVSNKNWRDCKEWKGILKPRYKKTQVPLIQQAIVSDVSMKNANEDQEQTFYLINSFKFMNKVESEIL